jgi:hypothetical protein
MKIIEEDEKKVIEEEEKVEESQRNREIPLDINVTRLKSVQGHDMREFHLK